MLENTSSSPSFFFTAGLRFAEFARVAARHNTHSIVSQIGVHWLLSSDLSPDTFPLSEKCKKMQYVVVWQVATQINKHNPGMYKWNTVDGKKEGNLYFGKVCGGGGEIFIPNDFSPGHYLIRWVRVKG